MSVLETIANRYSVRSYKPDAVEDEKLGKILEAARLAPTAANRQGFRVVVIPTDRYKEQLKRIYSPEWFTQPPYVLGIYAVPGEYAITKSGRSFGPVDASIAFTQILLAATELGLGTCWIGAFNDQAAKELPQVAPAWEPVGFTPLGYFEGREVKKIRKPLADLVIRL